MTNIAAYKYSIKIGVILLSICILGSHLVAQALNAKPKIDIDKVKLGLLKTALPWASKFSRNEYAIRCSSEKYSIYVKTDSIKTHAININEKSITAIAFSFGNKYDESSPEWHNWFFIGFIHQPKDSKAKLIYKFKLDQVSRCTINSLKTITLNGKPVLLVERAYSNSLCTPRGHLIDRDHYIIYGNAKPKNLCTINTRYERPTAASLPNIIKETKIEYGDFNNDGIDEIITISTSQIKGMVRRYNVQENSLHRVETNYSKEVLDELWPIQPDETKEGSP